MTSPKRPMNWLPNEVDPGTDGRWPAMHGIRVLDFTRAQQGPFATLLLADMGADVIRVEPPGGDRSRQRSPVDPKQSVRDRREQERKEEEAAREAQKREREEAREREKKEKE